MYNMYTDDDYETKLDQGNIFLRLKKKKKKIAEIMIKMIFINIII